MPGQGQGKATTVTLSHYTLGLLDEICKDQQLKRSAIVTIAITKYHEFIAQEKKRKEKLKEEGGKQWGIK